MIVSLDDQLEWQESSKSHSPRTPTAPEALQNLRKNSPVPTPSKGSTFLKSPEMLQELSAASGIDALEKLGETMALKTAKVVGDSLLFKDGTALPLQMLLPLQIRAIERAEDGTVSKSETNSPLTVGAAWLSVIAESTYESQLASLLRSRKNLEEICLDDRHIINRYLNGNLSLKGLMASRLWTGRIADECRAAGEIDLAKDTDDALSLRLRKRNQANMLEERRAILNDQQNRLRRLLARELQRQHSAKPVPLASSATSAAPILQGSEQASMGSNAVSSMLGKPSRAVSEPMVNEVKSVKITPTTDVEVGLSAAEENEAIQIRAKLKCLQIEWYRLCSKIRTCDETEKVLERRVKRMRYENNSNSLYCLFTRIDLAEALKIAE